ncbi:MAG: MopE-related protein [Bradymonadia bacterium]
MLVRWILLISVLVYGCFTTPNRDALDEAPAPDGNTFAADGEGVLRPTLIADHVSGASEGTVVVSDATELRGVVFDLGANSEPLIEVVAESSVPFQVFIYGPQTEQGLWGQSIHSSSGTGALTIERWRTTVGGQYLLLARPIEPAAFSYSVRVSCPNCESPQCVSELPCNTYCPQGRSLDATTGCLTCECLGASCVVDGCATDEDDCVFRCGEGFCKAEEMCVGGQCERSSCGDCGDGQACVSGMCETAAFECLPSVRLCESMCSAIREPVCAVIDGRSRTMPNECLAECLQPESIKRGPCMPSGCEGPSDCRVDEQCVDGMCVPDPTCVCRNEPDAAVCGENGEQVRTFRNRCEMDCAGFQLRYESACFERPTCNTSLDCLSAERCVPLPDARIPGNEARCTADSTSDHCVQSCISKRRCDLDSDCNANERCVPDQESGVCSPICMDSGSCNGDEACIFLLLSPLTSDAGVCVTQCGDNGGCNSGLVCSNAQDVCLSCDTCNTLPANEVCHRGQRFENGCDLLCGIESLDRSAIKPLTDEVCNGKDDDCDGLIDERVDRRCVTSVRGCEDGVQVCEAGAWGDCMPVPNNQVERCNQIDDDCDGDIDEGPILTQSGELECPSATPCSECDTDWLPVCTANGLMPNECLAQCNGLEVLEPSRCGLRDLPISRCMSDEDCMRSRCADPNGSICAGAAYVNQCVPLTEMSVCFSETSNCGCDRDRGVCGFIPHDGIDRCLGSNESDTPRDADAEPANP